MLCHYIELIYRGKSMYVLKNIRWCNKFTAMETMTDLQRFDFFCCVGFVYSITLEVVIYYIGFPYNFLFVLGIIYSKLILSFFGLCCLCVVFDKSLIDFRPIQAKEYKKKTKNNIARSMESRKYPKINKVYVNSVVQSLKIEISNENKKLIEQTIWYVAMLKRSTTIVDIFFCSIGYFQMMSTKSLTQHVIESDLATYFENLFNVNPQDEEVETLQSFEKLKDFRLFLGNYDKIKESELYIKIKKFIIYVLCKVSHDNSVFSFGSFGYTKMEEVALRRKYKSDVDLIYVILDTLTFIGEKGYEIYMTGRVDRILHNGAEYGEWADKFISLKMQFREMDQNPDFVESSFLADLEDTIEKGRCIQKFSKHLNKQEKLTFMQMLSELEIMKLDYNTKRRAREPRKVPFSLLVEGDSGIGKTTVLDILCIYFALSNGLRTCSTYRYTKNAFAEFWDNFCTYMHTIILDDIAFMKPDIAQGGDPSCMEFLQIINAVPYVPNQAALENKGKTPLKAKLVIGTTNTRNLNAHHYFACPSAAQRRFPFIVSATVKQEYRHENAVTLDSTKVPESTPGQFPDYWNWSVSIVKPIAGEASDRRKKLATEIDILENASLEEFLIWYSKAIDDHNKSQDVMINSLNGLQDVQLCYCKMPMNMCTCKTQSFIQRLDQANRFIWYWAFFAAILSFFYSIKEYIERWCLTYLMNRMNYALINMMSFNRMSNADPKIFMTYLGKKAEAAMKKPKQLSMFVSIAAACLAIYKIQTQYAVFQSFTGVEGKKCSTKTEDERENIWYKNDFVLNSFDMQPANLSTKGMDQSTFRGLIEKNIVKMNVQNGNTVMNNLAFCIYGHIYACNRHFLEKNLNYMFDIIQNNQAKGINGNVRTCITKADVLFFDSKNDLAFVELLCLPPKKDLRKYLIKDSFAAKCPGFLAVRDNAGYVDINTFRNCNYEVDNLFIDCSILVENSIVVRPKEQTKYGDCGAPLILQSELGFVIGGIHALLAHGNSITLRFDEKYIKMCEERFTRKTSASAPVLQSETAEFVLGDLDRKSPVRFQEEGTLTVYGSTPKFRTKPKTRVEHTILYDVFRNLGLSTKYTQPLMTGWEVWTTGLKEMVKCDSLVRTDVLLSVKESFKRDIRVLSDPEQLVEQVHILSDFETINGAPGVKFIDKANWNTSVGPPWNKSKRYFIKSVPARGQTLDPVDINDELKGRVKEALGRYKNDERYHFMYKAHLKDEPISQKKRAMKKTRIFCGASFDNTFIVRKYYLGVVRFMQNNRYIFENAPGINVDSVEWHDLYKYMTELGDDSMVAGDFVNYDKTMKAVFLHAAFDILDYIIELSGNYTEEDLKIQHGVREDLIYSLTDFNGDLVEFIGKNPSGNALTVILNGLVNCLYNRYAYHMLNPEHECDSFKENVRLMVYGDDNILGVNKKKAPWFNHTSIQRVYETMGIG